MNARSKAALWSFLRVLGATTLAAVCYAYLELGKTLGELTLADLDLVLSAGVGAAVLTTANALRTGDRRFGVNAVTPVPAVEPVATGPVPEYGPVPGTAEAAADARSERFDGGPRPFDS